MLPGLLSDWSQGFSNWTSGQDADPNGLYKPEDYHQARTNLLLKLGTSLFAAGQPMTGAQRAQMLQGLGNLPGDYRNDLRGSFEERKMSEEERRMAEMEAKIQSGDFSGLNENQIELLKAVGPRAATGKLLDYAFAKPAQPKRWNVNGNLIDESGNIVYQGQPAKTDDQREYEAAVAGGFKGNFFDYMTALRRSGASQTTVDMKAESAEEQGRGQGVAKRLNALVDDFDAAQQDMTAIQRLGQLSQTVDPGVRTALLNSLRQSTGIALDPNADNVQAFTSLTDYLAPRMRVPGTGASSDRDVAMFKNSLPTLLGTQQGNQLVVQTLNGLAQYRMQRGEIARKWQSGEITARQADAEMAKLPDPFATFRQSVGDSGADGPSLDDIDAELRRRGVQ